MKRLTVTLDNEISKDAAEEIMRLIAMIQGVWEVSPDMDHLQRTVDERIAMMNAVSNDIKNRERLLLASGIRTPSVLALEDQGDESIAWRSVPPNGKWRLVHTAEGIMKPLIERPLKTRLRVAPRLHELCDLVLVGMVDS